MEPSHGAMSARAQPHWALRLAPGLTLVVFLTPIVAGLAGTILPAFGFLPALGGDRLSLDPWRRLLDTPGFAAALTLTLTTGWSATLLSMLVAIGMAAALHHRPAGRRLGAWIAPALAIPHSALAIGMAFLILPSGWVLRALSPWLTGWNRPPDLGTVGHESGWPIVLALALKEVPYLVLMMLGALNQLPAASQLRAARAMGYGPAQAWLAVVLPQVLAQIRLPTMAVLAFSLSVVDVAMILGPGNPPTLAVMVVRWLGDPDPRWLFPAAAASALLLALVAVSLAAWRAIEAATQVALARWAMRGSRQPAIGRVANMAAGAGIAFLALTAASMLSLALWSVATRWRWPDAWPEGLTRATWLRQAGTLAGPAATTLALGLTATLLALALVLACLERDAEARAGTPSRGLALLYLPLLVPQVAFLFGLQVLLIRAGLDGSFGAVLWTHLVFTIPYLFLSLADPWRSYDDRYSRSALSLGASRWRVFWRIKLPILLPPVLIAAAVAFAVSAGLYLPTLLAGAGRVATLTTEAVTLSSGADRRVIGTWAMLQAAFPLLAYGTALAWPAMTRRLRRWQ
jgi:putative thiamine transport system permease protein